MPSARLDDNTKKRRQILYVGRREFDWRKASNYPASSCTDYERWAWEFLRRNREYQQAYLRFAQFGGREPSQHPIRDDDVLDCYFTHPAAPEGCTFREFLTKHEGTRSTVLLWSEYIRRVWLLRNPINPEDEYGKNVRFVSLRRRWKKNLAKQAKGAKKKVGREATVVSGERQQFPFDYYTEIAPDELFVRVRLYADDEKDIDLIAKILKDRIRKYRQVHTHYDYHDELHAVLRAWDFDESSRDVPRKLRSTRDLFATVLAKERDSEPLPPAKITRLLKYAKVLIDGRAYAALVAKAQREQE